MQKMFIKTVVCVSVFVSQKFLGVLRLHAASDDMIQMLCCLSIYRLMVAYLVVS